MMMLLVLSAFLAITDWIAVATSNRSLELFAKPATLLALCVWYATMLPPNAPIMSTLFLLGLALSLAGDVFLLFAETQFLRGLVSFLLAHVAYIAAYNRLGIVWSLPSLLILVVIGGLAALILRPMIRNMRRRERGSMIVPIMAYAVVLSITLWSTSVTTLRADWPVLASGMTAVGGALFFLSDTAIAWNRFVGPHKGGRVFEMITYHCAQFTLATGMLVYLGVFG